MIQTSTAMRVAFAKATADIPVRKRTAIYAMVRSAINRRVGLNGRKTMWSVERARR